VDIVQRLSRPDDVIVLAFLLQPSRPAKPPTLVGRFAFEPFQEG
jgi:hypothetical protein